MKDQIIDLLTGEPFLYPKKMAKQLEVWYGFAFQGLIMQLLVDKVDSFIAGPIHLKINFSDLDSAKQFYDLVPEDVLSQRKGRMVSFERDLPEKEMIDAKELRTVKLNQLDSFSDLISQLTKIEETYPDIASELSFKKQSRGMKEGILEFFVINKRLENDKEYTQKIKDLQIGFHNKYLKFKGKEQQYLEMKALFEDS